MPLITTTVQVKGHIKLLGICVKLHGTVDNQSQGRLRHQRQAQCESVSADIVETPHTAFLLCKAFLYGGNMTLNCDLSMPVKTNQSPFNSVDPLITNGVSLSVA